MVKHYIDWNKHSVFFSAYHYGQALLLRHQVQCAVLRTQVGAPFAPGQAGVTQMQGQQESSGQNHPDHSLARALFCLTQEPQCELYAHSDTNMKGQMVTFVNHPSYTLRWCSLKRQGFLMRMVVRPAQILERHSWSCSFNQKS